MSQHRHGDDGVNRANPDPVEERDRQLARAEFRDPEKREDPDASGHYDTRREIPAYDAADHDDRDPDEIERDIERTRADMDETLDALQRKLSPGQLMDQAFDYLRSGPGGFASNLGSTVRNNPVPVALTAIGLGWLMFSSARGEERVRTRRVTRYHYDDAYAAEDEDALASEEGYYGAADADPTLGGTYGRRYGTGYGAASGSSASPGTYTAPGGGAGGSYSRYSSDDGEGRLERARGRASGAAHEAGGRASGMAHEAKGRASGLMHEARGRASEFAHRASDMAHGARDRAAGWGEGVRHRASGAMRGTRGRAGGVGRMARQSASRGRDTLDYMLDEHPLVLGLVGVAIGAGIGALLPTTRREDEWLGESRDEYLEEAREFAEEEAERARRVAQAAGRAASDAAHEEADRQGLSGAKAKEAKAGSESKGAESKAGGASAS